jgi:RNA polymerase sigma-70 factor (ECF subfamily)
MDDCRPSDPSSGNRTDGDADWSTLMARAQNGDRSAYAALLKELAPYIRSISRRYFSAEEDVEDSLQDILLTVHGIRHTYDPCRPFGPWILAIARRRFADRLRRRCRIRDREIPLTAHLETLAAPDCIGHAVDLDRAVLHGAIRALPLAQRRAVELLRLRELSLKEASAESGVKQGALKVALHRAIRSLRQALAMR